MVNSKAPGLKHFSRVNDDPAVMDNTPIEIPAGFNEPPDLHELIRQITRTAVSQYARANETESFEEADDFDIPDEENLGTPYEMDFDKVSVKASNADLIRPEAKALVEDVKKLNAQQAEPAAQAPKAQS